MQAPNQALAAALMYNPVSRIKLGIMRMVKYACFLEGRLQARMMMQLMGWAADAFAAFPAYHYRRELVNRYPVVSATQRRLDFTYYEVRGRSVTARHRVVSMCNEQLLYAGAAARPRCPALTATLAASFCSFPPTLRCRPTRTRWWRPWSF